MERLLGFDEVMAGSDVPITTTNLTYTGNTRVQGKLDIVVAIDQIMNDLFLAVIKRIDKYCIFPLTINKGWGRWENNDAGTFYASVQESAGGMVGGFFGPKFREQTVTRINSQFDGPARKLHVFFYCPADYEAAREDIVRLVADRPDLGIETLLLYLHKKVSKSDEIMKFEKILFSHK